MFVYSYKITFSLEHRYFRVYNEFVLSRQYYFSVNQTQLVFVESLEAGIIIYLATEFICICKALLIDIINKKIFDKEDKSK